MVRYKQGIEGLRKRRITTARAKLRTYIRKCKSRKQEQLNATRIQQLADALIVEHIIIELRIPENDITRKNAALLFEMERFRKAQMRTTAPFRSGSSKYTANVTAIEENLKTHEYNINAILGEGGFDRFDELHQKYREILEKEGSLK